MERTHFYAANNNLSVVHGEQKKARNEASPPARSAREGKSTERPMPISKKVETSITLVKVP